MTLTSVNLIYSVAIVTTYQQLQVNTYNYSQIINSLTQNFDGKANKNFKSVTLTFGLQQIFGLQQQKDALSWDASRGLGIQVAFLPWFTRRQLVCLSVCIPAQQAHFPHEKMSSLKGNNSLPVIKGLH